MSSLVRNAGLSVLVLTFGIAAILVPGIAEAVPLESELVFLVGFLAILYGLSRAVRSWRAERSSAIPPVPETSVDLPAPGAAFDEELAALASTSLHNDDYQQWILKREEIRERLRELAVATLVDRYGISERDASRELDDGTWTEDPHAAAFFAGEYPRSTPARLYLQKLTPFTGTTVGMQARHAIEELGAIARGELEGQS